VHVRHLPGWGPASRVARVQTVAVVATTATAVLYFLIGLGVLWVGTSTSSDTTDLGAFGAIVGTVFAITALLLARFRSRLLWAAVAVLQVTVIVGYIVVGSVRSPAFEGWGLLVKACQVVILIAMGYMLLRGAEEPGPA
jgi:hypothetical protein